MTQEPVENRKASLSLAALHVLILLIGLGFLYVNPRQITGDGQIRFESLTELIEHKDLHRGDKKRPNEYSMVGPIFSAPLYLLGHKFESPEWWCVRFNFVVLLFSLADLTRILFRTVNGVTLCRFLLLLALATMFPRHQADYYGEVFTACFAAIGLALIATRDSLQGWFWLILATVNTPGTGLGLVLVACLWAWQNRRGRYLLAPVIAVGLIGFEAWIRRGNPALTGYEQVGGHGGIFLPYSDRDWFHHPFLFGLICVVFSMGKGILWFHPGIISSFSDYSRQEESPVRRVWLLWLVYLVGVVLLYSKWWCWWGGWFWGPRFFLFAGFPASLALAMRLNTIQQNSTFANLFLLFALVLSFWVGVNGLVFNQANLSIFLEKHTAHQAYIWHVPEFSVLWFPFVDPKQLTEMDKWTLGFYGCACLMVAMPVIVELCRRMMAGFAAATSTQFDLSKWRF